MRVSVSPCLSFVPWAGEALERGTRTQCPPLQAKNLWGLGDWTASQRSLLIRLNFWVLRA